MSLAAFHSLLVVAIGFAVAGLLAAAYQLITTRPPDFALLNGGARPTTFASIPFLIFAAPYIILRNTIHAGIEGQKFLVVTLSTILVGFWSLMCGTVVVMALEALGSLFA
jgi:hypothetical protein